MKRGTGNILIASGLLLIAAALVLLGRNLLESRQAGLAASGAADQLLSYVQSAQEETAAVEEEPQPKEMGIVIIDGKEYVATLAIPELELELGILHRCSDENLKIAPCRYTGSVYTRDMVIAAHNYPSHFGRLNQLEPGAQVILTDVEGTAYVYEVVLREVLQPGAVTEMSESVWNLTLFTCTPGGAQRLAVRCMQVFPEMVPQGLF